MADSLDDFFAKKDKKRKDKNKTSTISSVALVKELEEGAKQAEYQVRNQGKTSAALEILGLDSNDADWKDFEEIEKRDYTGLKVKEMSIQDQEDENRRQNERADSAPEPAPWRSKEATVAAITSANVDSSSVTEQQILGEIDEEKEDTEATKGTSDIKKDENIVSDSNKIDEGDSRIKDSEKQTIPEEAKYRAPTTDSSTKTESDTMKPDTTSAKAKYVPPHERGETKTLEPMRMKHLMRPGSSSNSAPINLQDENEYPSLG